MATANKDGDTTAGPSVSQQGNAPPGSVLRLSGLQRSFRRPGGGRLLALTLESLRANRGELLAVTGANGSGKTTLLHLIAGLLRPDRGRVVVAGQDLARLSEPALDRFRARQVGYLLQGGQLMQCLSAEENVMAALAFAQHPRKQRRQRARQLLDRVGVSDRAKHLPAELSGGERQRVALARALANDPPLLLADEPLANLDPSAASRMVALLRTEVQERRLCLVLVTHSPERFGAARILSLQPPAQDGGGDG